MNRLFTKLSAFYLAGLLSLTTAGCCAWSYCDCPPIILHFSLSPAGDFCSGTATGHTHLIFYDVFWKQTSDVVVDATCGVDVDWIGSPGYYVFMSDSTGAADTLRLVGLTREETEKKGCCSCGGAVKTVSYQVNGVGYTAASDHVNLPF